MAKKPLQAGGAALALTYSKYLERNPRRLVHYDASTHPLMDSAEVVELSFDILVHISDFGTWLTLYNTVLVITALYVISFVMFYSLTQRSFVLKPTKGWKDTAYDEQDYKRFFSKVSHGS